MLSERSEHETEEEKRKAQKEEKAKGNRSGSSASFKPEQCLGRLLLFGHILTRKQPDSL